MGRRSSSASKARDSAENRETISEVAVTEVATEEVAVDLGVGLRVRTLSKLAERSLADTTCTDGAPVDLPRD